MGCIYCCLHDKYCLDNFIRCVSDFILSIHIKYHDAGFHSLFDRINRAWGIDSKYPPVFQHCWKKACK